MNQTFMTNFGNKMNERGYDEFFNNFELINDKLENKVKNENSQSLDKYI